MKKISIALLAVMAFGVAQAATVEWASGNMKDALSPDITSVTAYYYAITGTTAGEYASMSDADLAKLLVKDGKVESVTGLTDGTAFYTATKSADAASMKFYATQETEENPAYALTLYVAQSDFGGTYALAHIADYAVDAMGNEVSTLGNIGGALDAYEQAGGNWAAVPEPTTIAFLALGLAAVGLKRKVA